MNHMSHEVFQIVQNMDKRKIENQLVMQCAPVIAGLKISNLLIVHEQCDELIRKLLKNTELSYVRLANIGSRITYLVYRRLEFQAYISNEEISGFLKKYGYKAFDTDSIIREFSYRYQKYADGLEAFPHEMGLILGYPLEDVEGFIAHNGKEFLHCGYWKVYSNMNSKIKLFEKFENVRDAMIHLISNGIDIRTVIEIYSLQGKAWV